VPADPYAGHQFAVLRLYGLLAEELEDTSDLDRAADLRVRLGRLDAVLDRILTDVPLHPDLGNSSVTP
jgi:hypothetical protein